MSDPNLQPASGVDRPSTVVVHCEGCGNDFPIARVGVTECGCGVKHTLVAS